MNERDKAIMKDIERFRVLSRDLIAELHFNNVKNRVTATNYVLKRLHRDKYIERSTERRQYLYFPAEGSIKKDSSKLNHFLQIAELYKDLCKVEKPRVFVVEPRYGQNSIQPDVFMIFKGSPFFVEVQRTQYSDKQMKQKMTTYDSYYLDGRWREEPWQPAGRNIFPVVWITGETKNEIGIRSYKVIKASTEEMLAIVNKSSKKS